MHRFILAEYYRCGNMHINFPKDKYVAYSMASEDVVRDLQRKGYTICDDEFENLGMQTIIDLYGEARSELRMLNRLWNECNNSQIGA